MVLRLLIRGGQGRLYDSSGEEESNSSSSESCSESSVHNYCIGIPEGDCEVKAAPPPIQFAKLLRSSGLAGQPAAELHYFAASRLDYSLCEERVDHLKWPSEAPHARRRHGQKKPSPRHLIIRYLLEGRRLLPPLPKKNASSAQAQDVHQRRVPIEHLPIYHSQNTVNWRSPGLSTLYPDVREERTWISYQGQKPRRGVHYNSHHKLRNYY